MSEKKYIDASKIRFSDLSNGLGLVWVTYKEWIDEMPAADVEEVRHGYWIPSQREYHWAETGVVDLITFGYKCSVCGAEENFKYKYCHCGAKMDKENEK